MEKEFCTYEQALALKELEFDELCFGTWDRPDKLWTGNPVNGVLDIPEDIILAPLFQQAFRWFRDKHNLYHKINLHDPDDKKTWRFQLDYIGGEIAYIHRANSDTYFKSYEEAEEACLNKLIEICKNK